MDQRIRRSGVFALLVIACCTSILAAEVGSERRVEIRRQSSQQEQRVRLPRRLSSRHNEITSTESSRKSSQHMLIGGHLRTEHPDESSDTETTSNDVNQSLSDSTLEDGLLLSSAGGGKDRKSSTYSSNNDDDDKKTLAQQVKEGKYGLLQDELFAKKLKRPGILSYKSNAEVPRDNLKSLGGLDEDEIWLAENHLLVIRGGGFGGSSTRGDTESLQSSEVSWPPIDDYNAPRRQVKIPPRPRVPPPFPVQLIDGGPVQLIGTNGTNLSAENETIDFEALPGGFRGFLPGEGPYFSLPSNNASANPAQPEKRTKAEGPFYPALPPGAVIVPPPSNQTDYDEDQSIYYPPPYSFVYPQNNSTDIPPGPLVPGIILPPPPDFFSSVDEAPKAKDKYLSASKRPSSTTPLPAVTVAAVSRPASFLPPRKSSTKLYKTPSVTALPPGNSKSRPSAYSPKPFSRSKVKNSSSSNSAFHRYRTEKTTYRTFVEVTTSAPIVKTTTLESPEPYHIQPILGNQVSDSDGSVTDKPWKSLIGSSKPVPLLTYYASTTTPSSIEQPIDTTPQAALKSIGLTTEQPTSRYPSQASYYFYEEASNDEPPVSSTPAPLLFFGSTAETPPYYKLDIAEQPEKQQKNYYEQIPSRPTTSKDNYNVKLIDSIAKDPQIYKYLDSGATTSNERESRFESSAVRNQSPRMLHSEPLYYQPVPTRSSPRLSYFSTPEPPKSYYDRPQIGEEFFGHSGSKSNPVYQYSFEASNYKREKPQPQIEAEPVNVYEAEPPQIPTPRRQKEASSLFNEYPDIQTVVGNSGSSSSNDQYQDYGVADKQLPTYLSSRKKERAYYPQSTTAVPIRATTLSSHQQYFTKQDEQLLDDVTKEYFTMFGKKLSSGNKHRQLLPNTTPIYGKSSVTTERPRQPARFSANSFSNDAAQPPNNHFHAANIRVHYGDATPGPFSSLDDDVLVNYKQPLPSIEPEADFISVVTPSSASIRNRYQAPARPAAVVSHVREYSPPFVGGRANSAAISLQGDTAVNYKPQRPPVNPDAEFISPVLAADKPNSYFAYRLPGDGGHFYFLTPQAIGRQEPSSYLYSRPSRASRPLPRRRRARDGDRA